MNKKTLIPVALAAAAGWTIWDNFRLTVTNYRVGFENLPRGFDGFTIVQVSDLHNAYFGKNQSRLISAIRAAEPNIIAITGDLFHTEKRNNSYLFLEQAAKIAPCFYVSGNHEQRFADYFTEIEPHLESLGAYVLDDERAEISKGGDKISVLGLSDPTFSAHIPPEILTDEKLSRLKSNDFAILLSHRPELFPIYARHNIALAFTGHAHGGQVRIPFAKRGLFAVHQGVFPKYTEGIITENNTKMIVSRGLGNSTYLPKINNPPELVVVKLFVEE